MDSFFGIGLMELFLIAVIALIVLGPERLPGAMRSVANFMRQIREIGSEFTSQFSEEIKMIEEMDPRRMINDVLDPSKSPNTAAKPGTKPAAKPTATQTAKPTTNNAAAGAAIPAKPLAASAAPQKAAAPQNATIPENEQNSILPPKSTPESLADPAPATPTKEASPMASDQTTSATDDNAASATRGTSAASDSAASASAEAQR